MKYYQKKIGRRTVAKNKKGEKFTQKTLLKKKRTGEKRITEKKEYFLNVNNICEYSYL